MIELESIGRVYRKNGAAVVGVQNVSMRIEAGEFVAILGPSGSGKSTLMNVLGLLDRPDSGRYLLNGQDVKDLDEKALAGLRNRVIGFVFQSYHLLPRTTALENVQLPLLYSKRTDIRGRSEAALEAVGLAHRASHFASELSGGQQQRVAIARAIVNEPAVLLADEPTGNLDPAAAEEIIALFEQLNRRGTTVILITHDESIAQRARRIIRIQAGQIVSDVVRDGAQVSARA